ncbi:MAG: DNA-binding domain-containing protein [Burkholderiales bacterium]
MDEAQRQRGLLQALTGAAAAGLREHGERAARGLEAYRANAEAVAARALGAAFPTVQAMVGDDDFNRLARAFWHAHPPLRGDLGEWGDAFAEWLQGHAAMAAWPYLGDSARLDFAIHANERAADAVADVASLSLLESVDPARLRMVLMPGTALLRSGWPIVGIHRAHQLEGEAAERAFADLRDAIAARHGESAFIVREGWRAVVHRLDPPDARWTESLLAGTRLATALEHAGDGFDFAGWLGRAIRHGWMKGVAALDD